MSNAEPSKYGRDWLKPEITIGSLANLVAIFGTAGGIYYAVASKADLALERVNAQNERITAVERRIDRESQSVLDGQRRVESAVDKLDNRVTRLIERLGPPPPK